jgi:hypothetical protein
MLRRVALVSTDVSEERIAYIIRVTVIGELGRTLAITIKRSARILHANYWSKFTVNTTCAKLQERTNSVAFSPQPTERSPLFGLIIANFCG